MITPFVGLPFESGAAPGLEAIEKSHRSSFMLPRKAGHIASVNVDECMRKRYPNSRRWDYGVWHGGKDAEIAFVEFHKAETGEIAVIIEKKKWLLGIITGVSIPDCEWYWIKTGSDKIIRHSHQWRLLIKERIKFVKSVQIK
jgi:hypothetical protein